MIKAHILVDAIPLVLFLMLIVWGAYKFAKMPIDDGLVWLIHLGEFLQRNQDYINSEANNVSHLNLPARIHEDFHHVYDEDNIEYKIVLIPITSLTLSTINQQHHETTQN